MSTKEAANRASKAHRARQLAKGYRSKTFLLSPGAVARLAELGAAAGSETRAVEALLAAPEPVAPSVPYAGEIVQRPMQKNRKGK